MSIAENLIEVRERIEAAEKVAGRPAGSVTLVAVSKTWPISYVDEAFAAGQRVFGENRVQELEEKAPRSDSGLEWHLIGHLQSNKVRKVLPLCTVIESVDSVSLAERVDRIAGELGIRTRILLQVNTDEDAAKFGVARADAESVGTKLLGLDHIEWAGLMTVPAFDADPEKVRPAFARLRELREELERKTGTLLPELSMGMSHDFPVAVEEGATIVRVGSSIFGCRY